jgi:pilus assembly protein CpaB
VFLLTQNASTSKLNLSDVVVALQDIPDRTVIQAGAVGIKAMPVDAVPVGSFTKIDDVIGKMAPSKVFAGEVLLPAKVVDTKGQTGLAFLMTKGKVLMTFPASNIVGLGLVKPGDSVDVLVTYRPKAKNSSTSTSTTDPGLMNITQSTLQDLKIVTVGGQTSAVPQAQAAPQSQPQQQTQISSVTFAIEPQDALTLKALKDSDELTIEVVLRAAGDSELYRTEPVTLKSALERYGVSPSLLLP